MAKAKAAKRKDLDVGPRGGCSHEEPGWRERCGMSKDYRGPKGDPTFKGPSEELVGNSARPGGDAGRTDAHDRAGGGRSDSGRTERARPSWCAEGKPPLYFGSDKKDFIVIPNPTDAEPGSAEDPLRDSVFTHNHPSGGAQSPDDVYVAASHNMKEIRAVVPGGVYSVRRVGKEWPPVAILRMSWWGK